MSTNIYLQRFQYLVYIHTCTVTGKSYIGYTSKSLEERLKGHLYDTKYGSTLAFHNALRKYTKDNFISNVLFMCYSKEDAAYAEIQLIETYNTFKNGYNETRGGDKPPGMIGRKGKDNPKSKQIIVDNVLYESTAMAVRTLKMDASTIYNYNKCPTGNIQLYAESKRTIRPIIIDNIKYKSIAEASRLLKIYIVRIREYVDNSLHLEYDSIHEYAALKRKTTPVIINGIHYESKKIAQQALGLSKYELNLITSQFS